MTNSNETKDCRLLIRRTLIGIACGVLALSACTDEQRRDLGEIDVRDELHDRVEQAVEDGGQSVDGNLRCTSNIAYSGQLSASCVGVTDSGDDVKGSFEGTADVEDERCEATLTIAVGDLEFDESRVTCFNE